MDTQAQELELISSGNRRTVTGSCTCVHKVQQHEHKGHAEQACVCQHLQDHSGRAWQT